MTHMKNKVLSAAIVALSFSAFAPTAQAQTADGSGDGAIVDAINGANNAAAAVMVDYDSKGNVVSLSAASAFGANGAAALATPLGSTSLGTSAPEASIELLPVSFNGPPVGLTVDFGVSDERIQRNL